MVPPFLERVVIQKSYRQISFCKWPSCLVDKVQLKESWLFIKWTFSKLFTEQSSLASIQEGSSRYRRCHESIIPLGYFDKYNPKFLFIMAIWHHLPYSKLTYRFLLLSTTSVNATSCHWIFWFNDHLAGIGCAESSSRHLRLYERRKLLLGQDMTGCHLWLPVETSYFFHWHFIFTKLGKICIVNSALQSTWISEVCRTRCGVGILLTFRKLVTRLPHLLVGT